MKLKAVTILGLMLSSASISCKGEEAIDVSEAKAIAYEKLSIAAPGKGVNITQLPSPTVERQEHKLIFDFKDHDQNAWVVVIVHPDGFAEVSFDEIKE